MLGPAVPIVFDLGTVLGATSLISFFTQAKKELNGSVPSGPEDYIAEADRTPS